MKTLRRLIHVEIIRTVIFMTIGFLGLFVFFDLVDELQKIGTKGVNGSVYQWHHAVAFVMLQLPVHIYELMPISLLVGSIFVMARMAQSSEFTILRVSGLDPMRMLRNLLSLGAIFAVLTWLAGDYLAPQADRWAQMLRATHRSNLSVGQTGAWLKERQGDSSFSVNVASVAGDSSMNGVRIFEFGPGGSLMTYTQAQKAVFGEGQWHLMGVERSVFTHLRGDTEARVEHQQAAKLDWPTQLNLEMVTASVLNPERMNTIDLYRYVRHLSDNGQSSQRYEIEFWRKVFYPLSCLVMLILALPFAYLHFRSGGITGQVFVGVMVGISFVLLNNVFGHFGNLKQWAPWFAAAMPSVIYTIGALALFGWRVLKR